jgi:hypothetical protein
MEEKIYVIESFGGEWSDSWQHIEGIWSDKDVAINIAEKYWEENGNYFNRLPIPYNIYMVNIHNFDVIEYNYTDYENESDYYLFKDAYGYTKEQWKETYDILERYDDRSYCFTSVSEYDLNTEMPERITVWRKHRIEPEEPDDDYRDSDYSDQGCTHTQINSFE